ncbi:MAG: cobyrinate a,c-diamide synthase [Candidatus Methanomethylicaceae archaeon]|nr:hydrogenobyrinic acid a,c-diamide synthase (glutamine-hydrolyzing) [Candidatus Verstraetearchaeota archaeon]
MRIPRVIISATSSDSGKTLIAAAIIKIMRKRGFKVQPFKIGPDFIDPMYLSKVSGRHCRNLDSWMMDENTLRRVFLSGCKGTDFAVIEGVRGLYEGESPIGDLGSTAHVAKILSAPVILVLDCKSLNRSAAAQIIGFQALDRKVNIAGVILNYVRDSLHEEKLRRAIQHYTKVPILGVLYRSSTLVIKKRHLGLITPNELSDTDLMINNATNLLEPRLDLERLLELMNSCPEIDGDVMEIPQSVGRTKIGIFMDAPFSFYYYDNLAVLRGMGAEISVMNSLSDGTIGNDISGILIGGGYPEVFARELEANQPLIKSIKDRILDEMPVVGECGGLIYLCRSINYNGEKRNMVGAFDGDVYFSNQPKALSYVELEGKAESPISDVGITLKGHEFHHSYVENIGSEFVFKVLRGNGIRDGLDGALVHRTVGMYTHLHYMTCPKVPAKFLSTCREYIRR